MAAHVMKLLLLTAVVGSASTAVTPGCCVPDQWQASIRQISSYNTNGVATQVIWQEILFTYDVVSQRTVEMVNKTTVSGTTRTITLHNYKTGLGYEYDTDTNQCKAVPSGFVLPKICLHVDAKVTNTNLPKKLGAGNVLATSAVYEYHSNSTSFYILSALKNDNCFPVTETTLFTNDNNVLVWHRTTLDLTESIPSNDVFNIPAAC